MPVKFGQTSIRFWFFLSYLITTASLHSKRFESLVSHFTFQKLGSIILYLEVIFTMIISLSQGLPTTPGSQSMILNCLGRNELFFDFDYFTTGGYDRQKWEYCDMENPLGRFSCLSALIIGVAVESNLLEIYLTGKILLKLKEQTINSASLMSKKDFQSRKR